MMKDGHSFPLTGTEYTAVKDGNWLRVRDIEGTALFSVQLKLIKRLEIRVAAELLTGIARIRDEAYAKGKDVGEVVAWHKLRKLIGAAEAEESR